MYVWCHSLNCIWSSLRRHRTHSHTLPASTKRFWTLWTLATVSRPGHLETRLDRHPARLRQKLGCVKLYWRSLSVLQGAIVSRWNQCWTFRNGLFQMNLWEEVASQVLFLRYFFALMPSLPGPLSLLHPLNFVCEYLLADLRAVISFLWYSYWAFLDHQMIVLQKVIFREHKHVGLTCKIFCTSQLCSHV